MNTKEGERLARIDRIIWEHPSISYADAVRRAEAEINRDEEMARMFVDLLRRLSRKEAA